MDLVSIAFTPLLPDELPGDPELGGWRPFPKSFYTTPQKPLTLSLEEVVKLVAFRLYEFELRQAIGIVAQRLAS